MALPKGSWEGSIVTEQNIRYLRRTKRLPPAEALVARAPGSERVLQPRAGEHVVFFSHFERGLGLPASLFFRAWLDFFGLQPHHLGANAVLQVAGFATLCEGYLGMLPTVELWAVMFFLKQQGASAGAMSDCGAAVVTGRPNGPFPKLPLEDSAKKWQTTFIYVRNVVPAVDVINLPEFHNAPPLEKPNWGYCPKRPAADAGMKEMAKICNWVAELAREGLKPVDLIAAFIARRVLPLQRRAHRICEMSDRHDPTRMSTAALSVAGVVQRVNFISKAALKEDEWGFGLEPYRRGNPAPSVSPWSWNFAASELLMRPDAARWP